MKMLLYYCTRLCVSLFIVLAVCPVNTYRIQYRYFPYVEDIQYTIEEGKTLSILYVARRQLKFVYPDSIGESINTSNYHIFYQMKNYIYNYTFTRQNTVFGDTGWYRSESIFFYEENLLYVFVKSNKNLFVKMDTNVHLNAVAGSSIVIPCRTTWPDLKPILINGNGDQLNNVSFDPKIGFTLRNLSLEDSNRYKCLIKKDDKEYAVSYELSILKHILPKPKIKVNDLFITRGEDLIMKCTIKMKMSTKPILEWNTPQKNNSRTRITKKVRNYSNKNAIRVTSQLKIFNVTNEDEGNYECIVRSNYDIKKIKKNIRIYDPQIKRIELLSEPNTLYFRRQTGSNFTLNVYIFTFFTPYIEWIGPKKLIRTQPLKNGSGIIEYYDSNGLNSSYINSSYIENYKSNGLNSSYLKSVSSLQIFNLELMLSPYFTIQVRNDYTVEERTFTLDVIDKPKSVNIRSLSFYPPYEITVFYCIVICNPPPNITWTFLKCPNYPSVENSTSVRLTNVTKIENYNLHGYHQYKLNMFTEISGKMRCEACTEFGCISTTKNITVLDPVPPFFVKTNMNGNKIRTIDVITEGQMTMILQCFADGMPKPKITWYKDNILLMENNQYQFKREHQELYIRYLMLHDSGNYSCRATNLIGRNETYQQIAVKNTKWHTIDLILIISMPIVGFILIILTIFFMVKIYREKKIRKELMEAGLLNFEEGALENINPNLTVDDQAELLPYDKKWEFPKDRLILKEQLGSGHFGTVMKADAIGICKNENITTVAVKMVRRTTNAIYIRALASELKIMVHLGKHLNVVNLLGAYTKNISKCELLVIVEYCRFGNLHHYLFKHRNDFINQINPKTGKHDFTINKEILTRAANSNDNSPYDRIKCAALPSCNLNANSDIDVTTHYSPRTNADSPETTLLPDYVLSSSLSQSEWRPNDCNVNKDHNPICTKDLLSWAFQVARGMEYLSQRKILHGDLAARNILLAEDNVVKICDFGLAKTMYNDDNYKKKSNDPLPIKWMAIESIKDRIFSIQSDVWSFGIMLWEFFTLAETPYPGIETEKLYQKLIEGYRMEQPNYAIHEIYNIMLQCWIVKPMLRPSFTDLVESVGNLLEESVRMHYIILNNPYMDINTMDMKSGKRDYLMMMSAPNHMFPSFLDNNGDKNTSLSKDTSDSSYLGMRSDSLIDESEIFKSKPHQEFALSVSVSEHAVELSSVQKHEEEPYLKPINVHERRAEFVRQKQVMKNQIVDSLIDQNYCNVPQNLFDKAEQHEPE